MATRTGGQCENGGENGWSWGIRPARTAQYCDLENGGEKPVEKNQGKKEKTGISSWGQLWPVWWWSPDLGVISMQEWSRHRWRFVECEPFCHHWMNLSRSENEASRHSVMFGLDLSSQVHGGIKREMIFFFLCLFVCSFFCSSPSSSSFLRCLTNGVEWRFVHLCLWAISWTTSRVTYLQLWLKLARVMVALDGRNNGTMKDKKLFYCHRQV